MERFLLVKDQKKLRDSAFAGASKRGGVPYCVGKRSMENGEAKGKRLKPCRQASSRDARDEAAGK